MWYVLNVITSVGRQIDVYWPIKIHKSYRPTVFLNVIAALHVKNRIYIKTRIDVYETLCPQQMLVHKGGKIKNWSGECRDVTPTNCSLKIYLKRARGGGGGGSGWRGQDGCE